MNASIQRTELKAFLRARRAALTPEAAGLPRGLRRLTPGLRREEVAALAGVGVTWYTWLEQGRAINVSAPALSRIARALSLSSTDEAYLFALMGLTRTDVPEHHFELPSVMQEVLDLYQAPAFVLDTVFNLLAWNRMAQCLYDFGEFSGPFADNHLWNAFMNPARRRLYPDFEDGALNLLGMFRMNQAAHPEDPRFQQLIEALNAASTEFVELWQRCHTAPLSAIIVPFFHPEFGDLSIHSMRLPIRDSDHVDRATAFFFAPADAETAASFARVARRLAAEQSTQSA
ncbi:helix-turn-helix transcriptional regulator [Rhodanobacter sp. T12-5]|uniref:helix-turn-helix transcriptional regulator n=1 Tax=Rhodanobacter sp. T12-5 TaxID=2024611 RepID=UPI0011EC86E5|nr:helix-turn-helix transcriptional regulator [Rhodanobacter sp. T12-5]KAA0069753.1 XRE family transcriptional regulator [Rhodanobacter sp. T12-5]